MLDETQQKLSNPLFFLLKPSVKIQKTQSSFSKKVISAFATADKDNDNVIQSMSRKCNCIDNAPMESFLGHFKDEVDYKICKTFEELVEKIDEYIYYYNNKRYQWNKLKMAPVEYRNHLLKVSRTTFFTLSSF